MIKDRNFSYSFINREPTAKKKREAIICKSLPDIFELINEIERQFSVDSIKLSDGTKIWNLIRVLLFFYPQKHGTNTKTKKMSLKTLYYLFKESFLPLNMSNKKIGVCGFSDTENRKFRNGVFYDIYMDPLYDVIGGNFYVFEWTTPTGYRRKYRGRVYSKNYVPMHIPIFSKTFLDLGMYKLLRRKRYSIGSESILREIITFFSKNTLINKEYLIQGIYGSIAVFFYMKEFFVKLFRNISPKAVLIRCGYGRFHMALSQACRELNIPSIELQHGIVTKYHAGYVKVTASQNKDCVPEYILTYGDAFSSIIKKGGLFANEKVITIGFPYMEKVKESPPVVDDRLEDFISNFSTNVLVTSQWIVADEIKNFIAEMSKGLEKSKHDVGIVFKPHPRDWRDYSDVKKHKNIFLASKYDDIYAILKVVDIHSTVYSTSGLEALAFGKPNIFIDVGMSIKDMFDVIDEKTSFIVNTPQRFIKKLEYIIANYDSISQDALKISETFFKPNAKKNFEIFLNSIGIRIKNE